MATCSKLPDMRAKLEDYLTPQRADVALQLVLDEIQATAAQALLAEQQATADLPPEQPAVANRHKRQQLDFSKLMPGTTSGIHTLKVGEEFLTDRKEIDAALAAYWEKVFTAPQLPTGAQAKQTQWLDDTLQQAEGLPTPPSWDDAFLETAIQYSGNSAPGPDGIPYSAFRKSAIARGILLQATKHLLHTGEMGWIPPDFNYSRLICLPKKPSGHTDTGEVYFLPEATRPLSIVNTDNRLMAAALKLALHDWMEKWISHHQQGFLTGRSMNDNILQVDY